MGPVNGTTISNGRKKGADEFAAFRFVARRSSARLVATSHGDVPRRSSGCRRPGLNIEDLLSKTRTVTTSRERRACRHRSLVVRPVISRRDAAASMRGAFCKQSRAGQCPKYRGSAGRSSGGNPRRVSAEHVPCYRFRQSPAGYVPPRSRRINPCRFGAIGCQHRGSPLGHHAPRHLREAPRARAGRHQRHHRLLPRIASKRQSRSVSPTRAHLARDLPTAPRAPRGKYLSPMRRRAPSGQRLSGKADVSRAVDGFVHLAGDIVVGRRLERSVRLCRKRSVSARSIGGIVGSRVTGSRAIVRSYCGYTAALSVAICHAELGVALTGQLHTVARAVPQLAQSAVIRLLPGLSRFRTRRPQLPGKFCQPLRIACRQRARARRQHLAKRRGIACVKPLRQPERAPGSALRVSRIERRYIVGAACQRRAYAAAAGCASRAVSHAELVRVAAAASSAVAAPVGGASVVAVSIVQ